MAFSDPYFPVFGPEKTHYLDSFHTANSYPLENFASKTLSLSLALFVAHQSHERQFFKSYQKP